MTSRSLLTLIGTFICTSIVTTAQITPTPALERMEGINRRKVLEANSLVNNVPFRNIGPTIMSGRAVDLDVNPADPTEFYVAYASGGLWYTRNNGQSFTPVFDHEDVITIGDFAVDWKTRKMWIGTGEVNSSRSSYAGVGMYFSADTGKTWQYKGLPESHHIGKVILHPSDPNTVWVAVLGHLFSSNPDRGVYKTTDGGTSWRKVLAGDDNTGAVDMQIDPKNPNTLYAALWHRERRMWNFVEGGTASGIYKSTDGGNNWSLLTNESSGFPTGDGVGRIGLSIYTSNPEIIYAVLDNQFKRPEEKADTSVLTAKDVKGMSKEQFLVVPEKKLEAFLRDNDFPDKYTAETVRSLVKKDSVSVAALVDYLNDANNSLFDTPVIGAEVYRSENGGKSWKKMNEEYLKHLFYTYGYYFGKVFVAPDDDKKIILCGVPLIMSNDGGKTFKTIDGENQHGDHHAVWMNPNKPGHMINCNDGGVNITYDDGASWYKANTPPVGQFYSVNVDNAKPYNVYGGLQDNGVWTGSSQSTLGVGWQDNGEYPFKFIMGGDGMQVMVDTRDNSTVYTGYQFGNYYRLDKNNPGYDNRITPRNDVGEPNYRFNWQTPLWLSKHNQDILYFGSNHFHRSMNKGADMKTLSTDLTAADRKGDVPFNTITAIHESPLRFGLIYVGTDDGRVWISKDAGYTFERIDAGLPQGIYVSRVQASAYSEGRVYVTLNGCRGDNFKPYIYVSEDYGKTWNALSSLLPYEPVNVLREDPSDPNLLFVGTDNGLYTTFDRGQHWMSMNGKLPRVSIHDLVIQQDADELVLGTHGRSIYIASLKELHQLTDSVRAMPLKLLTTSKLSLSSNWGKKPNEYEEVIQPQVKFCYYSNATTVVSIAIKSPGGLNVVTSTDSAEAGLNFGAMAAKLNTDAVIGFEKELQKTKKEKTFRLKKSDDGNYYLPAGDYVMHISAASGKLDTLKFTVIDPTQKEKNAPEPTMDPDASSIR
jgi:photosystem II stability/assembly factor-like uncharacterized protein